MADEYIIVLKQGLAVPDLFDHIDQLKGDFAFSSNPEMNAVIQHWVIGKFLGIHAKLSTDMLAKERAREDVAYIEVNGIARIVQDTECIIQEDSIWNLARVNERDINLVDDLYQYQFKGEDVDVYIIDTGIRVTHEDFSIGRAEWGTNTVGDGQDRDCNGHGTHVASTVGGVLYGMAKNATVVAVKVLGCSGSGSWAGVISGIQWVTNNRNRARGSVANMSLGGGLMQAVNDAVNQGVDDGTVYVVASGNSNADACTFSPASATKAIRIGIATVTALT
jgi:subtilisin family serine protease